MRLHLLLAAVLAVAVGSAGTAAASKAAALVETEACLSLAVAQQAAERRAAAAEGGKPLKLVIKSPTDVLEHDDGLGGQSALNADMYHHKGAAPEEPDAPGNGTSCCSGLLCPYEAGICCPGSTHCCDQGYICSDDYPPQCLDERVDEQAQAAPVRNRITHVTVRTKGKVQHHRISPSRLGGLHTHKGLNLNLQAARDNFFDPSANGPVVTKATLPAGRSDENFDPAALAATAGEKAQQLGTPWPPMLAFAPDGTARSYVAEEQRDWGGRGLVRAGARNIVDTEAACRAQCDSLPECRVARYVRTNGECQLDSLVASSPQPCPAVGGKHNCVSFVKRLTEQDVEAFPFPNRAGLTLGEWGVAASNWLPSSEEVAARGGRLLRNGKHNRVSREEDCVSQCAGLRHCAVAMYIRPTGECWLSSKVARAGVPCAVRQGQRSCASYVKRKKDEVNLSDRRPLDASLVSSGAGAAAAGTVVANADGGDQTLTVNVRQ